jgi:hypothetical protein
VSYPQNIGDKLELAAVCWQGCGSQGMSVQRQADGQNESVALHRVHLTCIVLNECDASSKQGTYGEHGMDPWT